MSDLDSKLREILDELWPLPEWHSDDPNEMADYQEREVSKAIAQIKQAFKDAGYVPRLSKEKHPDYMTGQEWYERFDKAVRKPLLHELKGFDYGDVAGIFSVVETAAQKAADLEEMEEE